jgi:hypothetical protein
MNRTGVQCLALAAWSLLGCSGKAAGEPKAPLVPVASPPAEPERVADTPPHSECVKPAIEPAVKGDDSRVARRGKPVECSPLCTSESIEYVSCVDGHVVTETISAPCDCGPMTPGGDMGTCAIEHMTLRPMADSPAVDGCELDLRCERGDLRVDCDDEQDGTGTSLCDCYLNGKQLRTTSGPISDPGAASCYAAAPGCLAAITGG